jgi:hypothetical protein
MINKIDNTFVRRLLLCLTLPWIVLMILVVFILSWVVYLLDSIPGLTIGEIWDFITNVQVAWKWREPRAVTEMKRAFDERIGGDGQSA